LQSFAIMPALATYSTDPGALKRATIVGATLSGSFILFSFLPKEIQIFAIQPNFIGNMISCLYMGTYHVAYAIQSALGLLVTWGSLFALALSAFVWPNNWRIGLYHGVMALFTLFVPQWLFGVSTGEAAAIYCFYSIPITGSFVPAFKKYFTPSPAEAEAAFDLRGSA